MAQPLHFLQAGSIAYSLDGYSAAPESLLDGSVSFPQVLLSVSTDGIRVDTGSLQAAKTFARRYVVNALHHQLEIDLHEGHASINSENYRALFKTLQKHLEASPEDRRRMVAEAVEQWLSNITPKRARRDIAHINRISFELRGGDLNNELDADKFRTKYVNTALEGHPKAKSIYRQRVSDTLKRMPEWIQVLTHQHGALVVGAPHLEEREEGTLGKSFSEGHSPLMLIYMNPELVLQRNKPALLKATLFEELLHAVHVRQDLILEASDEEHSTFDRWQKVATRLIHKIDANRETSPAVKLICRAEPGGGSLFTATTPLGRTQELLVDVFECEMYLREHDGLNKTEARKELVSAFGQEVYDVSREYLQHFMNRAAKALEETIGKTKAVHFRQKWEEDPLEHIITLPTLSKYKIPHEEREL